MRGLQFVQCRMADVFWENDWMERDDRLLCVLLLTPGTWPVFCLTGADDVGVCCQVARPSKDRGSLMWLGLSSAAAWRTFHVRSSLLTAGSTIWPGRRSHAGRASNFNG